ncbi:MAG: hypothetical protein NTU57_00905 [Candidatus Aenigmarchaeota archaeon]|nr:hypothetical protein [Candidatus Aenigmarchaeota archaeon]
MVLDLIKEITSNRFLIIMMEESEYTARMEEIINGVEKTKTKICYVCLSKPVKDVKEELSKQGFNLSDFFFIDVLTSHYHDPEPCKDCFFVRSPRDLAAIRVAIKEAVEKKSCSVILFDTISTLLIYQQTSSVVSFTHSIMSDDTKENVKKLFILLKQDTIPQEENDKLMKDLGMFADKTINFG